MKNDIGCYVSDLKVMQPNAGYYVWPGLLGKSIS